MLATDCRGYRLPRGDLFLSHAQRLSKPFLILDALGTAAYGVVGASKGWEAGLAIPACIFVGVVNAAGSGIIRDVLVREEPLIFKPGQFYVDRFGPRCHRIHVARGSSCTCRYCQRHLPGSP